MKLRVVLVIVVCIFGAAACNNQDTRGGGKWGRTVEPRLSGMTWQERRKVPRRFRPAGVCDETVETMEDAMRVLATNLRCIDEAIDALERHARADATVLSDLAGAYSIRAQTANEPADYLTALEILERAPASPAAHFNRALVQEALGLYDKALRSYESVQDESGWTAEARQRHAALRQEIAAGAMEQWKRTRPKLEEALHTRNAVLVAKLVDPFPAAAQRHFETEVLRRWAASGSAEDLERAELLASALSARLGDPYFNDAVEAIRKEPAAGLQYGHLQFARGRQLDLMFAPAQAAYAEAARAFARAKSPFRLAAQLGVATARQDLTALEPLEREIRAAGYKALLARVTWTRAALMTTIRNEYLDAVEQYDSAVAQYTALRDRESELSTRVRRAGVYTAVGQPELAWKDLFRQLREQRFIGLSKEVQTLAGECAQAVSALGHPFTAVRYREMAVDRIRNELQRTQPDDTSTREHLLTRLGAALRSLAEAEIAAGRFEEATIHLRDSERYGIPKDSRIQRDLGARSAEVRGKQLLRRSPRLAIVEFSEAIRFAGPNLPTVVARLHAQRAAAYRRLGERGAAERDLRTAIDIISREEQVTVLNDRGTGEPIWSGYFSRFEETYALLIQHLIEDGRPIEAFGYAERARGFEPLHRILRLPHTPAAFVRIARERRLQHIQASLPPGTFILEYSVLENETFTWVISRDRIDLVPQTAKRSDVERWTRELHDAVESGDHERFERHLVAPYHGLIEAALAKVRESHRGTPRLVIVPDRVMQGLPFAALRSSTTGPYLIQEAIIELQGSALLYVFSLMRDGAMPRDPSLLLIGNPDFDRRLPVAAGLTGLRHAEQEVRKIDALHGNRSALRIGREATAGAFLELARSHAIVHLALHAVVIARAPHRSVLLLAHASDGDRGALEAQELLRRAKLDRTRLVILATCSSAGGAPVGPEGVGPLVRPLLAAGVPAVLGTLWRINDATAQQVLVSFHQHFETGSDAAVALREAQLKLLGPDTKPLALERAMTWAPYQVIGHATSPYGTPMKKEEPP